MQQRISTTEVRLSFAGTIVESMGLDQIKRVVFFIHSEIPRNPRSDEENGRLSGRLLESTNCPLLLLFFLSETKGKREGIIRENQRKMILLFFFLLRRSEERLMIGSCALFRNLEEVSDRVRDRSRGVAMRAASFIGSNWIDCLTFATTLFYCVWTLSAILGLPHGDVSFSSPFPNSLTRMLTLGLESFVPLPLHSRYFSSARTIAESFVVRQIEFFSRYGIREWRMRQWKSLKKMLLFYTFCNCYFSYCYKIYIFFFINALAITSFHCVKRMMR